MLSIKNNKKGFTIVETLIVLAVVGAIMLVVFLAVPALQRNSRNTSLKNDASNVLAAVSEFSTNNNGSVPTAVAVSSGSVTLSSTVAGTQSTGASVKSGTLVTLSTLASGALTFPTVTGSITIGINAKCVGNTSATYTNRSVVAALLVETASGTATQCIDG